MKKFLVLLVLFSALSCKKKAKNVAEHPVRYIPVSIVMYPNDPLNFKIQAIGGWTYIDGGLNGIIVYRKSAEEFVALERTSPQLPDDPKARANVLSDNFTLADTISGSQWRIFDGAVTKGPTEWTLRLYGTTYDGSVLKIRN
jgi:hypothetical protein